MPGADVWTLILGPYGVAVVAIIAVIGLWRAHAGAQDARIKDLVGQRDANLLLANTSASALAKVLDGLENVQRDTSEVKRLLTERR